MKLVAGCAWQGCRETFSDTMPKGWVWLLAYWAAEPQIVLDVPSMRDAALCPTHARTLDAQLKPIPRSAAAAVPLPE
jgi:hypothetical protein